MKKRARKCYLWGSSKDKVKEGIKIHSALRALRARRARVPGPLFGAPKSRAAQRKIFFGGSIFIKGKNSGGDASKISQKFALFLERWGGSWEPSSIKQLKLNLHSASKGPTKTNQNAKNLKIEPSLGIKWPHKNKPKRRKAQD